MPVSADIEWQNIFTSGTWKDISPYHYCKEGENNGFAEWRTNVTGFNGYWFKHESRQWDTWGDWTTWFGWVPFIGLLTKRCYTLITFYFVFDDGANKLFIKVQISGKNELGGLVNTKTVEVCDAAFNINSWDDLKKGLTSEFQSYGFFSDVYWSHPTYFQLWVKRESNGTSVTFVFDVYNDEDTGRKRTFNQTLSSNVTITFAIAQEGMGLVEGVMQHSVDMIPPIPPFIVQKRNWWNEIWSIDWGAIFSTLFLVVNFFLCFVKIMVPVAGVLVLIYVLDVIFTAVLTGEPRLVGELFTRLFEVVRGIWQTLVNTAHALYDLITFWS